jgi:cytochrome c-type biogenesis protein CcmH/NrfG
VKLRQWSRTAFALAALFASFPIVGRIVLGEWAFEGAGGIAGLWLAAGSYLHVRSRRVKAAPDPAAMLDEAVRLASIGEAERAVAMLGRAIRENPWFWQAYQCRGEIRFTTGDTAGAAADFDEAIRLAPGEAHLRELREQVEISRPNLDSPDGSL